MVDWYAVGPRAVLVAVLLVTNVALVGAMSTSTTPYGPYNPNWDGTSQFRSTVTEAGVDTDVVLETTAYEDVAANETTAFVVAPEGSYDVASRARIRQFVRRGGTLVVAAESTETNTLLSDVGATARIEDGLLRDEQSNYRSAALPVATNVSDHQFVDGVEQLTLNYARSIAPGNGSVLVATSPTTYVDRNGNETLDSNETVGSFPVVTVESVGSGRVVLVSDASVFTNALADRDGNRAFVEALVADSETAVLDQSHAGPIPPLRYALIVLRTTPLVQFGLALAAFGLFAFVSAGGPGRVSRLIRSIRGNRTGAAVELSEDEIAAYLSNQHPDWDDARVRRVTKAIIRRKDEPGNDD